MVYNQIDIGKRRSTGRSHLLILGAYLLLTLLMTWPLATQLTTAIPGDGFDGWQNYWNQWWIKVALLERLQQPFQTDLLYYPTGVDLYFHTLNPFNGFTTLPVQLSLGLIAAYNAVVLLSWPLAGYGVYLLVRWLLANTARQTTRSSLPATVAAFVAGAIFTFSPFHMAHLLGHMQVMSLQWIPFYVLYLLRATTQARRGQPWTRAAAVAGLFLTLTGLCDWYFVLYLFFFTGLVLLWQWGAMARARQWDRRLLQVGLAPVGAGLLMVLLLSPLLVPMVRAATQFSFMVRPTSDLYILSASVMDFLIPNRLHTLWRATEIRWIGNQIAPLSERTIAIGYIALLLALFALGTLLVSRFRTNRQQPAFAWRQPFWLGSALLFLMLALGPQWHIGNIDYADIPTPGNEPWQWTPFALLNEFVPFMRISRSVSRYALMVQLSVAVLAGLGLHSVLTGMGPVGARGRQVLTTAVLLGLILFEYWMVPYPTTEPDTPAFYRTLGAAAPPGAVLNLPMNFDRPGYLLYQTVHQRPLAVAYISRDDPRTMTERVPLLQQWRHLGPDIIAADPVAIGRTVLSDLGISVVVQDRYKMPGGTERSYTETLANRLFAGQPPHHEDDRLTVHFVEPPASPQPYLRLGALHWGPLTVAADGSRQRALTGAAVELQIVHGANLASNAALQLRYRTLPQVGLTVQGQAQPENRTTLSPAPTGATVSLALSALGRDRATESFTLLLQPAQPDAVWIESLALLPEGE